MATLTVQKIRHAGIAPTFQAAESGGDKFAPASHRYLHVKNGGGSAITVTVDSVQTCNQGVDHNVQVSVPASGERLIGGFPTPRFAGSDGLASITYSAVTSVTVAAIEVVPDGL